MFNAAVLAFGVLADDYNIDVIVALRDPWYGESEGDVSVQVQVLVELVVVCVLLSPFSQNSKQDAFIAFEARLHLLVLEVKVVQDIEFNWSMHSNKDLLHGF
jgi:hypothetical protein